MGVAEKEKVLKDVANIRNTRDEEGRLYPATSYLKPDDVEVRTEELDFLEKQLNVGPWVGMTDEGRANLNKRKAVLTRELRHGVPPEIDGATKDALGKKLKHLEKQIADGMPTHEAMRRNPAGAVDHHMKWEEYNKSAILERKNILRVLNPGNKDKDLCNIDLLRKSQIPIGKDASVMIGAQVPGKFAYHNVPEKNWDETFNAGLPAEDKGALGEITKAEKAKANRVAGAARAREARARKKDMGEERL